MICFCFILFYILLLIFYKSKNLQRHQDSQSLYAHFSKIDTYNYFLFPLLCMAHPISIKLKAGESIFIPKNWWHWIKTTKKTFAINYWFTNNDNNEQPFIFDYTDDKLDISILDNELVNVWNSLTNEFYETCNFNYFYTS